MPDPWDRLPGESSKAFHAFTHYRDLPPHARSIRAAHQEHLRDCEGRENAEKVSDRNWQRWSSANNWTDRAASHDSDLSRKRRARNASRLEDAQDGIVGMADQFLSTLKERLDGIDPEEIAANSVPQWFKIAAEMQLKALGYDGKAGGANPAAPPTGPVNRRWDDEEGPMSLLLPEDE